MLKVDLHLNKYVGMENDEVYGLVEQSKFQVSIKCSVVEQIYAICISILTLGLMLIFRKCREECLGRYIHVIPSNLIHVFKEVISQFNINFASKDCSARLRELGNDRIWKKIEDVAEDASF